MLTTTTRDNLERLDFISTLRGLAALAVAVVHLRYITTPAPIAPGWLETLIPFFAHGVTLFFIISAFTLCLSMDKRKQEPYPLASFFLRRFFRIAPLFYAWLAISLVRDFYMYGSQQPFERVALSLTFVFNLIPGEQNGIALASWSIGVEMLFYLIFPFIYTVTKTVRSATLSLMVSLAVAGIWKSTLLSMSAGNPTLLQFIHPSFLNQQPIFFIGILTYRVFQHIKGMGVRVGLALLATSCAGLMLSAYHLIPIVNSLYATAFFLALLVMGMGMVPLPALVNRNTIFLGEISYSIYLAHTSGCYIVQLVIGDIYKVLPQFWAFVTTYALLVVVVVPMSWVTYKLIEQPGNKAGRFIIALLRRRPPPPPIIKPPDAASAA